MPSDAIVGAPSDGVAAFVGERVGGTNWSGSVVSVAYSG